MNRQTFPSINITFRRTTYAGGKNVIATFLLIIYMGATVVVNPETRHPITTTSHSDVSGRKLCEVKMAHQSVTGSIMCYVVGLLLSVDHFCRFSIITDRIRRMGTVLFTVCQSTPRRGWGGGYPIPGLDRGYPIPGPSGGVPQPRFRQGVTHPRSRQGWGVNHPRSRWEGLPHPRSRWGYPTPGLDEGYPIPGQGRGLPHTRSRRGLPHPRSGQEGTPSKVQAGGTPSQVQAGVGVPHPRSRQGGNPSS